MSLGRLAAILIIALTPSALWCQDSKVKYDNLWHWFQRCHAKRDLGVEVVLNGKMIYKSSFPVYPISHRSETEENFQKVLAFFFKGGHTFQGEYRTVPSQKIEGNIWQAGTDPGVLILGLSFSTKTKILLNTLHIVKQDGESRSVLDRGLFVRTFPADRK